MRYSEIITEAKSKGVWLYHGTQLANLQSLKKHGLDSKFSKVRAGLIHLSSDPNQAAGYFNNFGLDGPGILLRVNSSALDQTKLGPDREDLMDILDQRRSQKEWYECDWKQSLRMCGQCTYDGAIPASLLTVEDCEIDDKRVVFPVPLLDFDIPRVDERYEIITESPDFIRVGNVTVPFSTMEDIFYSVYDYVTYGEMMKPDQFDSSFEHLDSIVPAALRAVKGELYRVVRLTDDQYTALKNGDPVQMDYRKFVSFSYSLPAMKVFARQRIKSSLAHWHKHTTAVLLRFPTPPGEVVVNVPAVYRAFSMLGDESWSQYAKKEMEVIVRMNDPLIVTPDSIVEVYTR